MRRFLRTASLLLAAVLLLEPAVPAARAQTEPVTVAVAFTHDMHAHFLPTLTSGGTVGGYARLKTALDAYRSQYPDALVLDGGDFSMGTLFQTIYSDAAPDLRTLGALGYDVVTLGNHEFDYRGQGLARMLNSAADSGDELPQIVLANGEFPAGDDGTLSSTLQQLRQAMDDYGVQPYTVLEQGGVRIGIFGLMGKDAADCAPLSDMTFTDPIEAAKKTVAQLVNEEQVDLVICLSHSGTWTDPSISEDELLAQAVPDIDLIISGHTHTRLETPITVGSTVIASCGENGQALGTLQLTQTDGGWALAGYALKPIDDSLAEDAAISQRIGEYKALVQQDYLDGFGLDFDQVLTRTSFDFVPASQIGLVHREEGLANLITDSYLYAVAQAQGEDADPVDVTLVPSGTIRGSFLTGDITVSDAFTVSSLGIGADGSAGYPLISVYLTGRELKTACEVDASVAPIMSAAQLYMSGINYTFNPRRMLFNKVVSAEMADGSAIRDDELYHVVCGLYCAQMLFLVGDKSYGILEIVPKDENGAAIEDFESRIITTQVNGRQVELKEWLALAQYLQSFGERGVPAEYKGTLGRKNIDNSLSPSSLLKNWNWISWAVLGIVTVVLGLVAWLFAALATRKRRRSRRAALLDRAAS